MCCYQLSFLQADPETEFLVQDVLGDPYLWRGGRWSWAASIPCWLVVKSGWKKGLDVCPWLPSSWGLWGVQWSWTWHWGLLTYTHGSPTMTFVSGQIWESKWWWNICCSNQDWLWEGTSNPSLRSRARGCPWGVYILYHPMPAYTHCTHREPRALSVKRDISEKEQWYQSGDFRSAVQTRPHVT